MQAIISLTNSCNYRCSYCITKSYANHAKQCNKSGHAEIRGCILDLDALIAYLDKFVPMGSIITLTGGEPMTAPYFGTLLKMLAPRYKIIVETNGSQLFKIPEGIDCSNIRLLIAWHPKMITWNKFSANIKSFVEKNIFPIANIKFMQIIVYADGKKTAVNNYPDGFSVIVNDGAMPDFGVPINEPSIFVRPNGKVMSCPSSQAKYIGDIYEGTLDTNDLFGCKKCSINGKVWCNSFKNVYFAFR